MILSIHLKAESEHSLEVQTDEARIYTLLQPDAIFEELCAREETKDWLLQRYRDNEKPLFVVGYRTLLNAKVMRNPHVQSSIMGKIQTLPVLVAGPSDHDTSRIEASASHNYGSNGMLQYLAEGERIFAICYRKINFKFHKQALDASLQRKSFWKEARLRGNTLEGEIAVEPVLESESDWPDDEICAKAKVGGTMFVLLPPETDDD